MYGVPKDLFGFLEGRQTYVIAKDGTVKLVFNNQFQPEKCAPPSRRLSRGCARACRASRHAAAGTLTRPWQPCRSECGESQVCPVKTELRGPSCRPAAYSLLPASGGASTCSELCILWQPAAGFRAANAIASGG